MAGGGSANMEMFKFAVYLFFPIGVMAYFSDPQWYDRNVAPYRDVVWPVESSLNHPPTSRQGAVDQLTSLKLAREKANAAATAALANGMDKIHAVRAAEESAIMTKLGMREKRVRMDGLLGGFAKEEDDGSRRKGWGFGGGGGRSEGGERVVEAAAAAGGVREKLV
ncbi:hypothetical protein BDY24DRAFT_388023 [Mrakia frigida]|uniref:uncharacterized protein n=1 Tax=Mrakia frigida TaxID=29902 RepID=UPI003FCBEE93